MCIAGLFQLLPDKPGAAANIDDCDGFVLNQCPERVGGDHVAGVAQFAEKIGLVALRPFIVKRLGGIPSAS